MIDWTFASIAEAKSKVDEFGDMNSLSDKERNLLLEALLSISKPSKASLLSYFDREREKGIDVEELIEKINNGRME